GDARYAIEVFDPHDDFVQANPVGLGVNWTCTMDVAIRAFNWAIALELIERGAPTAAERREQIYASLFAYGHFIERNLENNYEVTSNHFLSNVVGLFGMALLFKDLPSGAKWIAQCREWLEQEMRVQVLPDGADYESSVPYHRLVAELFMAGDQLAHCDGAALSQEYRSRLRSMTSFLDAVLRPDGRLPQVGDADDGRLHIFSNYGRWEPQDGRHLLAPASLLFAAPEWWRNDDSWAAWEAAWWGLEPSEAVAATPAAIQKLFPDAGLAVFKDRQRYLLVTNGVVGTNGFGNHKHNDLLSFEYHDRGAAVIVDPGSYVYTSNPDARNQFRSTKGHNTLSIDHEEQNEFRPEWLFRMFAKAQPEHVEFVADAERSRYRGRHDGYARLPQPVIHERSFELEHATGVLQIADRLTGDGTHSLVWRFHCAPGVSVAVGADGSLALRCGALAWSLRSLDRLTPFLEEGWYSPSYGVRLPAKAIEFRIEQRLTRQHDWTFRLEPQS
ncbi:MAG: alginate lyase family protein, partial [Vicinamibacterales bacterium]